MQQQQKKEKKNTFEIIVVVYQFFPVSAHSELSWDNSQIYFIHPRLRILVTIERHK